MPIAREEFVSLLTTSQRRIYAFIGTLVADRVDADDVLQETNLALWELADRFEPGTDFVAWACRVAYFRVLKHRSAARKLRVNLVHEVVDLLAAESLAQTQLDSLADTEQFERHRHALAACLAEIPERNRCLLLQYYEQGRSLAEIGASVGRHANAIAQLFHRIRGLLRKCIRRRLADMTP